MSEELYHRIAWNLLVFYGTCWFFMELADIDGRSGKLPDLTRSKMKRDNKKPAKNGE
jgi:hypothetical protein